MVRAPRLYLIASQAVCGDRPLLDVARRVLDALARLALPPGTVALQLREKELQATALLAVARPLRELTGVAGVPFFVNDRLDVALAVGADGVHLGGHSLGLADAARVAPSLAFALSTHSPDELVEAARLRSGGEIPQLAFAVFGPIYDTPSKRAFGPPQGLARLRAATEAAANLPVLALGGLDADPAKRAAVATAGAQGIACMRAVWGSRDPVGALVALLDLDERPLPLTR